MKIVFDLDGTLIDSRLRLYRLFRHLVPASPLSFEQYWALKRAKIGHQAILARDPGYGPEAIARFQRDWMALIEAPAYLALDGTFPGMPEALARLAGQAELHLCTARQSRPPVLEQLERLGLSGYFASVLVTAQTRSKESLLAAHLPGLGPGDWLVGDTGTDILTGRALGLGTCAVLSGFLSRASLLPYRPDLILESAVAFQPPGRRDQ